MAEKEQYSKEFLLKLYEDMYRIRQFELRAKECFTKGMLAGNIHLSIGQEGSMVGCAQALEDRDFITTTHRGHGHSIAKGGKTYIMMAELFGKETGYCKGKGGSMHIVDTSLGILGANGIVGAGIPIATGSALASYIKGKDEVTMCFFGDAASNQGTFHEAINMAAAWHLPIVYICENNQYGVSTDIHRVINTDTISVRAKAYDIPGITIDGRNVLEVYEAAKTAVEHARSGKGPYLIEVLVYRWEGHYCGDPANYRPKEYLVEAQEKDPILYIRNYMLNEGIATEEEVDKVKSMIDKEIEDAVEFADKSSYPDPKEALTDVYSMDNERSVLR